MFTFSSLVADLGTVALSVHNICGSCATFTIASPRAWEGQLGSGRPGVGLWTDVQSETDRAVSRRAALWTGGAATLLYLLLRSPLLQFYHLEATTWLWAVRS